MLRFRGRLICEKFEKLSYLVQQKSAENIEIIRTIEFVPHCQVETFHELFGV